MTRCDLCWAGFGLWAYLYLDVEHGEALHDMTLSLASLVPVCVCGSMSPGWGKDPADLIEHVHGIGHRIVERYAPVLLERAELACRRAREAGDEARVRGIQTNIDLLQLAKERR
jgi:hypothetical protein